MRVGAVLALAGGLLGAVTPTGIDDATHLPATATLVRLDDPSQALATALAGVAAVESIDVSGEPSEGLFVARVSLVGKGPISGVRANLKAFHDALEHGLATLGTNRRFERSDAPAASTSQFMVDGDGRRLVGRAVAMVEKNGPLRAYVALCIATGAALGSPRRCDDIVDGFIVTRDPAGLERLTGQEDE